MYKYFFVYEYDTDKVTETFYNSQVNVSPESAFQMYIKTLGEGNYKLLSGKLIK